MNQPEEQEPRIIVDDDWKEQAQQEKEKLQQERQKSSERESFPPASFPMLVSMLSTQSMAALGFLGDPSANEVEVNLDVAKHFIDSLAVLEEKTKGNLDTEEEELLRNTLHQLRMAFVQIKEQVGEGPQGSGSENTTDSGPSIELP